MGFLGDRSTGQKRPERPQKLHQSCLGGASGIGYRMPMVHPVLIPWLKLIARLTATVVLMGALLWRIDWPSFVDTFRSLDWRWWGAGLLVLLGSHWFAGVRWAHLARPLGFEFSTLSFVMRFFEGQFFSLCLPTSIGGDVVKAYRLAPSAQGRLLAGCSVIADRLTGLSALAVLAGTTLMGLQWELSLPTVALIGIALLVSAAVLCMLAVSSLDRLVSVIPQGHRVREFLSRLLPYQQRPSLMAQAVGYSVLVQAGSVLGVALFARGMGLDVPLPVWFYTVPLVSLAMVLPISISGVGVREGGLAFLLSRFGVSPEQGVALGLLWFLATIVGGVLGGAVFLSGVTNLRNSHRSDKQASHPDVLEPNPTTG